MDISFKVASKVFSFEELIQLRFLTMDCVQLANAIFCNFKAGKNFKCKSEMGLNFLNFLYERITQQCLKKSGKVVSKKWIGLMQNVLNMLKIKKNMFGGHLKTTTL